MLRKLFLGFLILASSGVAQDAFAARFGLQTGFYNESIKTPCASSREFGLRLGFYTDKTTNDILYASAVNGTNICGTGGCGGGGGGAMPAPSDCGCGHAAASAPSYYSAPAPVQTAAVPTKTEIYLLVLPNNTPSYQPQAPAYYQQPPMADYRRAPPQGYYREPDYQEPVRGLW